MKDLGNLHKTPLVTILTFLSGERGVCERSVQDDKLLNHFYSPLVMNKENPWKGFISSGNFKVS